MLSKIYLIDETAVSPMLIGQPRNERIIILISCLQRSMMQQLGINPSRSLRLCSSYQKFKRRPLHNASSIYLSYEKRVVL